MLLRISVGLAAMSENNKSNNTTIMNFYHDVNDSNINTGHYSQQQSAIHTVSPTPANSILLDGLDEVQIEYRDQCVAAINQFACTYDLGGLAVCCRITEYKALSQRLKFGFAVRLKHLTQSQIQAYLQQAGERFSSLNQLLQQDKKLRKLARSPFMLSVMSFAYENMPIQEVQQSQASDLKQRQSQLFDAYIEQTLQRKGKLQPDEKEEIKHKLSWLGFQMQQHGQSVFMLENVQTSWLSCTGQQWSFALIYGLIIGMIGGLIDAGLEKQLSKDKVQPNQGIRFTLKNSLVLGSVWGILFGLLMGSAMWVLVLNNHTLATNLFIGVSVSIFGGFLYYGGGSIIQHYSLRLTLCLFKTFPLNAIPFLDHCTKLILLRRVGGGYLFIHRLLLEHFAQKYRKK
ncbi:hypothetical protein [Candidatus Albibeggiatoa sp. nov. BB20]|uniref:NACHT domain-containing protein n=1 Tax=Candidatus Albibeggiatoa sp. nov. BB20 TaxID=3162723 RepID=UPI0033656360